MERNIGFLGFGNMGQALASSFLKHMPADRIFAVDHHDEGIVRLGIQQCQSLQELVGRVDVLILAVKPQTFRKISFADVHIPQHVLVISIMAGVGLEELKTFLKTERVVRAMPNIAVKTDQGVIGWIASSAVSMEEKQFVQTVFSTGGFAFELLDEKMIHALTAVSGSGPAYFFHLAESLAQAGVRAGFAPELADHIARQTLLGAGMMVGVDSRDLSELRASVTSKGGTTEAALQYLHEQNFSDVVEKAVEKAQDRSEELSQ